LSVSTTRLKKRLCITVANQSYSEEIPLSVEVREAGIVSVAGRMLSAPAATAENSFASPKVVAPVRLNLTADGSTFHHVLPPHSFAVFTLALK
jgi:alpha-L-arabinofuranosidase